jgi:hypothetical protein
MLVGRRRALDLLAAWLLLTLSGCHEAPAHSPDRTAVTRPLGSWRGRGNQTVGVVSESGRLRVTWQTSNESAGAGRFRLALHSAVSGRPIQLLADQRGESSGLAEVADDPRPYNFMVDSENVDWSFTVEEIVGVAAGRH